MKMFSGTKRTRLYRAVFGHDIFISYSRKDGLDYAYAIAKHFMQNGYDCYIDQLSSISPGKELPQTIKHAVKNTTAFVLIGSEGAKQSQPIENEVGLFLKHNRNKPIIPISVDGSIDQGAGWFGHIEGLAFIEETGANLTQGSPAPEVLDRIASALKFTRKSARLRRIAIGTVLGVLAFTLTAIGYVFYVVNKAEQKVVSANQLAAGAEANARKANESAGRANQLTEIANQQKWIADSLKGKAIAEKEVVDSLRNLSDKMARSNSLASAAFNLLRTDPTQSYRLAKEAMGQYKTPEACNAVFMAAAAAPFYRSMPGIMVKPFPNGKYLAALQSDGSIRVMDWNGEWVNGPYQVIQGFDPAADTDWEVNGDNESITLTGFVKRTGPVVFNLISGKKIDLRINPSPSETVPLKNLGVSRDGKNCLRYSQKEILVYDIHDDSLLKKASVKFPYFEPDGALLFHEKKKLIVWDSTRIYFVDIRRQKIIDKIEDQQGIYEVTLPNYLPDARIGLNHYLHYSSRGGDFLQSIYLLPLEIDRIELPRSGNSGNSIDRGYSDIQFSKKNDEMVLVYPGNNNALVLSTEKIHFDYNLVGGHTAEILCSAISDNKKQIITGGMDNIAVIWDNTQRIRATIKHLLKGHKSPVVQVYLSTDGKTAVTASEDRTIKFWDLRVSDLTAYRDALVRYNTQSDTYEVKEEDGWRNTGISPGSIMKPVNPK